VAHPTDGKLMRRAREKLVKLAKKTGVRLRLSYDRVGKRALIAHQRYAHAKQFKRQPGVEDDPRLSRPRDARHCPQDQGKGVAAKPLRQAAHAGAPRARAAAASARAEGHSLHAPEVECIGKGKAHRPYESASRRRWRRR